MKRIIGGLMIILWLATIVSGCQTETPLSQVKQYEAIANPVTSTPRKLVVPEGRTSFNVTDGILKLDSYAVDSSRGLLLVNLTMKWKDGRTEPLGLTAGIRNQHSTGDWTVWSTLSDQRGTTKWGYEFGWNAQDSGLFRLTERSQNDQLTIVRDQRQPGRQTETYLSGNGKKASYSYPVDLLEKAAASEPLTVLEHETFDSLARQFKEDDIVANSLNNNAYGLLLNDIISSQLTEVMVPGGAVSTPNSGLLTSFCSLLTAGATAKCVLGGGPANPVCWALAISAALCWFSVCVLQLCGVQNV